MFQPEPTSNPPIEIELPVKLDTWQRRLAYAARRAVKMGYKQKVGFALNPHDDKERCVLQLAYTGGFSRAEPVNSPAHCPCAICVRHNNPPGSVYGIIGVHLNDDQHWSVERIARWLDTNPGG